MGILGRERHAVVASADTRHDMDAILVKRKATIWRPVYS
jgi:hypothetical protein